MGSSHMRRQGFVGIKAANEGTEGVVLRRLYRLLATLDFVVVSWGD